MLNAMVLSITLIGMDAMTLMMHVGLMAIISLLIMKSMSSLRLEKSNIAKS